MNEMILSGNKQIRDVRLTNVRLFTMTRETDVFKINNTRLLVMEKVPLPQKITNIRLITMEKVS